MLAPTFTVDSDTQITVTIPVGAVSGPVSVMTPVGTAQSYYPFAILSTAAPTITDFNPKTGGGAKVVTLTGTNFAGVTQVTFNGFPALSLQIDSDTQVTVRVPRGAGTGMVVVTNNIGSATSTASFVGLPDLRIVSVTPQTGKPGDTITLTGAHFTGAINVTLGGATATYTVVNDTTMTLTVPAGATFDQIDFQTPNGDDYSDLFQLLAAGAPTVTMVSPLSTTTGMNITITGTNLNHVMQAKVGGVPVTANAGSATTFSIASERPVSGTITITNNAGSVTTTQSVTIGPAPVIADIQPSSGKIGDSITISGTGLTGATLVHFGMASGGARHGERHARSRSRFRPARPPVSPASTCRGAPPTGKRGPSFACSPPGHPPSPASLRKAVPTERPCRSPGPT